MLQQLRANARYIWVFIFLAFIGGFMLYETSGLIGQGPVTSTTTVASVNGRDILYTTWVEVSSQMATAQEQQQGRSLTLDERRQVEDQAFNEMVSNILLNDEYKRRGIRVTDAEIVDMARYNPPEQFQRLPELQTDGRFDPSKYQRFLASPAARQQGILVNLENYFRAEIPKQKLFAQVAGDVYVSDARLWTIYRDTHDSTTVSYVQFQPAPTKEERDAVTDAEARTYYEAHKAEYERPGTAVLSILALTRRATAADTAETLTKIRALREEIVRGTKLEDVARRESDDSMSAAKGGNLERTVKGAYVKPFDDAVFSLPIGALSQPIKTEYGYHLVRVDKRTADTAFAHHVLKLVKQGDSAASHTDRQADQLAKTAAGSTTPSAFDDAAKQVGLLVSRITADEGQPANYLGRQVPSASAWAFSGVRPGETSDLFDDETAYYLVRLDSLREGGVAPFDEVKIQVRDVLAKRKALDAALPRATELSKAAAGSTLEAAAKTANRPVVKEGPFARSTPIAAFGFVSQVTGAAFVLPVGAVSEPVRTDEALYVIRVDKRVATDTAKWVAQKVIQRQQVMNSLRDQRLRLYLQNLRKAAKVDDKRKQLNAAIRRQTPI